MKIKALSLLIWGILQALSLHSIALAQDPLTALLQKAQQQQQQAIQPDHALVQIAVFFHQSNDEKKRSDQLLSILQAQASLFVTQYQALKPKKELSTIELIKSSRLSALPINQDLPINLSAIIQAAGDYQRQIQAAQAVSFFRYQGRPLKQQQQITWLCQLSIAVTEQVEPTAVIVNLSTFEAFDLKGFKERCQDLKQGWYKPAIELLEDQSVRLFSRGLSQFARPDVEVSPLSKDKASQSFTLFQKDLLWLRFNRFKPSSSKSVNGKITEKCERNSLSYDHQCVRLQY